MAKTAPGAENVLNISQPEIYRCQIYHYHSRLSRLYLSIFKGQSTAPALYVLFTDVGYLDCPTTWQGANFSIAPREECIELMLQTGLIGKAILQFPDAYASVTDYARLYEIKALEHPVRIIASSATLLNSLPGELQ